FNLDRNDKSKPYGYKLTQVNAVLSLPTLSAQESLLFHLAREYLAGLLPSRMFAAMDGFFHEADYQLNPTSPNQKERSWLKKVRV
ncbi:hypothetical protein OFC55_38295, partial [Escherichia coli]|nr:hypothetical protein [Escherichia coli]